MANIDPNYREWQSRAARKIVGQFRDGTMEVVAKRGAELSDGRMTVDECMARQIVGIMLAHQVNEPAAKEPEQQTFMGRKMVKVDMDLSKLADITFRGMTPQDAENVLRRPAKQVNEPAEMLDARWLSIPRVPAPSLDFEQSNNSSESLDPNQAELRSGDSDTHNHRGKRDEARNHKDRSDKDSDSVS